MGAYSIDSTLFLGVPPEPTLPTHGFHRDGRPDNPERRAPTLRHFGRATVTLVSALKARPARHRGVRCSRWRFQQLVSRAYAGLPHHVQASLDNVAVVVEDAAREESG